MKEELIIIASLAIIIIFLIGFACYVVEQFAKMLNELSRIYNHLNTLRKFQDRMEAKVCTQLTHLKNSIVQSDRVHANIYQSQQEFLNEIRKGEHHD